MIFISAGKLRQQYRIFHFDGKIQLHHTICSQLNTLVAEWPDNFPGGFSLETIHDLMEDHSHMIHNIFID